MSTAHREGDALKARAWEHLCAEMALISDRPAVFEDAWAWYLHARSETEEVVS